MSLLYRLIVVATAFITLLGSPAWAADALPGWRAGATKAAIVTFVARVTDAGSKEFVPAPERIAVFDNDGTLWSEQPLYVQVQFAFDRMRAMAAQHPEWQQNPVFKAVIDGDMKGAMAAGEKGLIGVVLATHAGPVDAFRQSTRDWLRDARHPATGKAYDAMTYRPMRELLDYLRANGFKTYIVTGGDVEFVRAWAEAAYGIPPEQVVGSRLAVELAEVDGKQQPVRAPRLDVLNDGEGKVASIATFIGRRPILAFGNSDGDLAMLRYTTDGTGPRLGALLHHTDGAREVAYDRESRVGRLSKGLDEAAERHWLIADMARDWATVF